MISTFVRKARLTSAIGNAKNSLLMRRYVFFLWFMAVTAFLGAQEDARNTGSALLLRFSYAFQMPGGDLAQRFGNNFNLGLGMDYLTSDRSYLLGAEFEFLFGNQVKTDVLSALRTAEGFIIGNDRNIADVQLRERGLYAGAVLGKIIPLSTVNPRSGLRVALGAGWLQHNIRIQGDPQRSVPQIEGPYKKGYDRLSNGFALRQFVAYQLLDSNGRINFYAGLEFTQGFTRNRRPFDFDTRSHEDVARVDFLFGVRIGWVLPFYLDNADELSY